MKRRHFLLGGGAAAIGGGLLLRPSDKGAPHDAYFEALNQELQANGPMHPCIVIDLDKLDHNIDVVSQDCAAMGKDFRIVAKSIPSQGLLDYVMKRSGSPRLMSFHQPFLNAHALDFPDADILLGKPMPARSAEIFYQKHQGQFDPARQLQWLIDSPERLNQYLALAQGQQLKLNINIELDVGLHRGGVTAGEDLAQMLSTIAAHPEQLHFSGFMGYDPHVVKLPGLMGSPAELMQKAMQDYAAALEQVQNQQPALMHDKLCLNTAGSPSYRLHADETLSTELAIGSALVKPTDFEIPTLDKHQAAAYIATPILKASNDVFLPGLNEWSKGFSRWDVNQQRSYFIYGGYWKAQFASPAGLQSNAIFGRSTNQDLVNGSQRTALQVDDQIFLRPTQSEFVFLQFGDLITVRNGKIQDAWPVYPQPV